ncbi:helix-turn-helix transcriptional regulator [Cryomorphaceae bacterium 1068]|nr:helix-turn-helix transcriptional regulator [Cryomorphaceae bacterium 1068]
MTLIGKNIRKIRGVKNMSQSAFAQLFKLKRASIGAYEEGRAEPKISTIVEIANYFGISVDDLLLKDLSVNTLFRLDIFKDDFNGDAPNNLTPKNKVAGIIEVPYMEIESEKDYFKYERPLDELPVLSLPLEKGRRYLAYEIGLEGILLKDSMLSRGDVAICRLSDRQKPEALEVSRVYLFEFKETFLVSRVLARSLSKLKLGDESEFSYPKEYDTRDLMRIWEIRAVIANSVSEKSFFEKRLSALEEELQIIKNRLKTDE